MYSLQQVRVFTFRTGKLIRVFDETLARYTEMQHTNQAIPNMEYGRRYKLTNEPLWV